MSLLYISKQELLTSSLNSTLCKHQSVRRKESWLLKEGGIGLPYVNTNQLDANNLGY